MNRRAFLAGAAFGMAGLTTGGAAFGLNGRGDLQSRELDGSAAPGGWPQPLGQRRLVWSVPTAAPLAALTFDDGPDPQLTPQILEVLAEHGATATFNVMGWNATRHPDLVRAVSRPAMSSATTPGPTWTSPGSPPARPATSSTWAARRSRRPPRSGRAGSAHPAVS